MILLAGCASSPEDQVADSIVECMQGNGGVEAQDVVASLEGGVLLAITLSYEGQGSSLYDAVYESCVPVVADDSGLRLSPDLP